MLPELPKPDFEDGYKGAFEVIGRRVALWQPFAEHSPSIVNTASEIFQSPNVRLLHDRAEQILNPQNPGQLLLIKNLFFTPREAFLRASPFHGDIWTRDEFAACMALNDPELEKHFLDNIVKTKRKDGHVPTTRLIAGNRAWFFDDESSALALVWRAKIARMGIALNPNEFQAYKEILAWVESHVDSYGYYVTSDGLEKSWLDTYKFPKGPITYNQGVYTASLLSAEILGLPVKKSAFEKAKDSYNNMTDVHNRLQMGRNLPYSDLSAFYGEYLANLFDQKILDTDIVKSTKQDLFREQYGYRVNSKWNGEYLDPNDFIRPHEAQPGEYQHGTTWHFFDFVANSVFHNHGIDVDTQLIADGLGSLIATHNAEFVRTGSSVMKLGLYNPSRIDHTWNAACYAIAKKLLPVQE